MLEIDDQALETFEHTVKNLDAAKDCLEQIELSISKAVLLGGSNEMLRMMFDKKKEATTLYVNMLKSSNIFLSSYGRRIVYSTVEKKHYISW